MQFYNFFTYIKSNGFKYFRYPFNLVPGNPHTVSQKRFFLIREARNVDFRRCNATAFDGIADDFRQQSLD